MELSTAEQIMRHTGNAALRQQDSRNRVKGNAVGTENRHATDRLRKHDESPFQKKSSCFWCAFTAKNCVFTVGQEQTPHTSTAFTEFEYNMFQDQHYLESYENLTAQSLGTSLSQIKCMVQNVHNDQLNALSLF
jgi:hypothetical protein